MTFGIFLRETGFEAASQDDEDYASSDAICQQIVATKIQKKKSSKCNIQESDFQELMRLHLL